MPTTLLTETAASLSELKNDPMVYEVLMDELEDTELAALVESRKFQAEIDVAWDELLKPRVKIAYHSTITSKTHAFR